MNERSYAPFRIDSGVIWLAANKFLRHTFFLNVFVIFYGAIKRNWFYYSFIKNVRRIFVSAPLEVGIPVQFTPDSAPNLPFVRSMSRLIKVARRLFSVAGGSYLARTCNRSCTARFASGSDAFPFANRDHLRRDNALLFLARGISLWHHRPDGRYGFDHPRCNIWLTRRINIRTCDI